MLALNGVSRNLEIKSIAELISKHAEFGLMSFSQIDIKGLLATLVQYRDNTLVEYKEPINNIMDVVLKMELQQKETFTFVFCENESSLEYIGLTVYKTKNNIDKVVFDYNIYTYSYEEPKLAAEKKPRGESKSYWPCPNLLKWYYGTPTENIKESGKGKDNPSSNRKLMNKRGSQKDRIPNNQLEMCCGQTTRAKIEALKKGLFDELANKGIDTSDFIKKNVI